MSTVENVYSRKADHVHGSTACQWPQAGNEDELNYGYFCFRFVWTVYTRSTCHGMMKYMPMNAMDCAHSMIDQNIYL